MPRRPDTKLASPGTRTQSASELRLVENWRRVRLEWCSNGLPRNAKTAACARKLADEMDRWLDDGGPIPKEATLVAALRCGGTTVPIWACEDMSLIGARVGDPIGFATRVFRASTSPARGWMMRFFDGPKDALLAIVELALADKSVRVREWACEGVERTEAKQFLAKVQAMAEADPHADVRDAAARAHAMLTQGYYAEPDEQGKGWRISIKTDPKSFDVEFVASRVVDAFGMAEVVRMIRKDRLDPRLGLGDVSIGGRISGP